MHCCQRGTGPPIAIRVSLTWQGAFLHRETRLTHRAASLTAFDVFSYPLYGARPYPGGVSSSGISSSKSLPSSPMIHIFSPSSSRPPNFNDRASFNILQNQLLPILDTEGEGLLPLEIPKFRLFHDNLCVHTPHLLSEFLQQIRLTWQALVLGAHLCQFLLRAVGFRTCRSPTTS